MKLLVVYYSHTGNTKEYAERIASATGADIMELKPVKDIPNSKFGGIMTGGFLASMGLGTKLHSAGVSPLVYEKIIIGTPVWAGKTCAAVNEFIKQYDVADKVSGAFILSGSGNADSCIEVLNKKFPNLKTTVSLADKYNSELYKYNEDKLNDFIENI